MRLIDKNKLLEELKKLKQNLSASPIVVIEDVESLVENLEVKEVEVPVNNDLEEALEDYAYQVAYDISHDWLKENATWDDVETAVKLGAQWQKEHLWKDVQGDDLPEIDREVIALIEAFGHYKVIFAHRVDENAEIHTSIDGKPLVLHPKKHGKGGWNISNIKWWLDIELPKMEE